MVGDADDTVASLQMWRLVLWVSSFYMASNANDGPLKPPLSKNNNALHTNSCPKAIEKTWR